MTKQTKPAHALELIAQAYLEEEIAAEAARDDGDEAQSVARTLSIAYARATGQEAITADTTDLLLAVSLRERERSLLLAAGITRAQFEGTIQQMIGRLVREIKENIRAAGETDFQVFQPAKTLPRARVAGGGQNAMSSQVNSLTTRGGEYET